MDDGVIPALSEACHLADDEQQQRQREEIGAHRGVEAEAVPQRMEVLPAEIVGALRGGAIGYRLGNSEQRKERYS